MSGYRYDYPLAPAPRSAWRSAVTNIAAVAAIAVVSGIGGAAIVLELVASPQSPADGRSLARTVSVAPVSGTQPGSTADARAATDTNGRTARVIATVPAVASDDKTLGSTVAAAPQPDPLPAQPAQVAAQSPAPAAPETPAPAQIDSDSSSSPMMSASDLTFAKGYARRRAAREASVKSVEPPKEDVKQGDVKKDDVKDTKETKKPEKTARAPVKRRPVSETSVAQVYDMPDGRRVTVYRNYRADRGDFNDRHERRATSGFGGPFAFSDDYAPRPMRRVQGPGFFDGLF